MHQTLIVARMEPSETEAVAKIFAESDAGDLPAMIGVTRRTLFRFHNLYFHLAQADQDINRKLAEHIRPYDPNWREPKDAMAEPFYTWEASR